MELIRSFKRFLDRHFMACTFAEEGEHQTARTILTKEQKPLERKRVRQRPRMYLRPQR